MGLLQVLPRAGFGCALVPWLGIGVCCFGRSPPLPSFLSAQHAIFSRSFQVALRPVGDRFRGSPFGQSEILEQPMVLRSWVGWYSTRAWIIRLRPVCLSELGQYDSGQFDLDQLGFIRLRPKKYQRYFVQLRPNFCCDFRRSLVCNVERPGYVNASQSWTKRFCCGSRCRVARLWPPESSRSGRRRTPSLRGCTHYVDIAFFLMAKRDEYHGGPSASTSSSFGSVSFV